MKGFDRDYILKQLTDYAHNPQEALITVIREGSILVANDIYDVVAPNLIDKDAIEVKAKGGAIDNMYIFTHPIGRWLVSTYI